MSTTGTHDTRSQPHHGPAHSAPGRGRRRGMALACLVALTTNACATWAPARGTPRELLTYAHPDRIRVEHVDGTVLEARNPTLVGDTIREGPHPVIALSDVHAVEVRRTNVGRTVAAVVGTLLLGIVAVGVVSCAQSSYAC